MTRRSKPKKPKQRPGLHVRLPLPRKAETRHADPTKYDRRREKERLRRELPQRPDSD